MAIASRPAQRPHPGLQETWTTKKEALDGLLKDSRPKTAPPKKKELDERSNALAVKVDDRHLELSGKVDSIDASGKDLRINGFTQRQWETVYARRIEGLGDRNPVGEKVEALSDEGVSRVLSRLSSREDVPKDAVETALGGEKKELTPDEKRAQLRSRASLVGARSDAVQEEFKAERKRNLSSYRQVSVTFGETMANIEEGLKAVGTGASPKESGGKPDAPNESPDKQGSTNKSDSPDEDPIEKARKAILDFIERAEGKEARDRAEAAMREEDRKAEKGDGSKPNLWELNKRYDDLKRKGLITDEDGQNLYDELIGKHMKNGVLDANDPGLEQSANTAGAILGMASDDPDEDDPDKALARIIKSPKAIEYAAKVANPSEESGESLEAIQFANGWVDRFFLRRLVQVEKSLDPGQDEDQDKKDNFVGDKSDKVIGRAMAPEAVKSRETQAIESLLDGKQAPEEAARSEMNVQQVADDLDVSPDEASRLRGVLLASEGFKSMIAQTRLQGQEDNVISNAALLHNVRKIAKERSAD